MICCLLQRMKSILLHWTSLGVIGILKFVKRIGIKRHFQHLKDCLNLIECHLGYKCTSNVSTFMDAVTQGFAWCFTLDLDNILVFSKTFDEHMIHLERVFQCLCEANLKLKAKKCLFCQAETPYLGHIITSDGFVKMDPQKVVAVQQFPIPKTKLALQCFLGLAGYYRHFVPRFAEIAAPLTDLTHGSQNIKIEGYALEAFEQIKERLCSAPVLCHVDYSKPFILQTDASNIAVAAILSQKDENGKEYVIGFGSKKLTPAQRKWDTHNIRDICSYYGVVNIP